MREFLKILQASDAVFMRHALIAGLMASAAFGVIGSYVVARRISYMAGAIAHSVLGGIGLALYMQRAQGLAWCDPMLGAVAAALLSAVIIGLVSIYAKEREDAAIGAVWSVGMATGLLFLAKTPGYFDPMSYLFGNILMISSRDLYIVAALDVVIVTTGLLFYNRFLALCFDEEFATLRGLRVRFLYLLLLCLTALTIVLLVSVIGIVLVIALLTLPAATAAHMTRRLWQMMAAATAFCMFYVVTGLAASYAYDLPAGPVIILIAGAVYLLAAFMKHICK